MNRILTYGLAAVVTTFLAQPVYADKGGHDGGGHGGGGGARSGGGGHASVAHASVGHANVMRGPSVSHVSAPIAHTRSSTTFTPSVTQSRAFVQPQRNSPTIAFGGHAINNNNAAVNAQNGRSFAATQGGNARDWRPPTETSRGWDRGRVHEWNHHRYQYYDGDWMILNGGYPYGSGSPYGSYYGDEPVPDSSPAYSYDYSSSEPLAMSVQDQLTRLGYSPGPVDGVIGPQTRDAIVDFQNDHRLPVTGQIDTALLRALGVQ